MASASYPMSRLGGKAFNHSTSGDAEAEYDRLRAQARQEAAQRSSCFDKAHQAYERGDGGAAHQLSEEGKRHAAKMDQFNKQASDYIFRENNAPGRVADDTIDLHGQFVEEAEDILEQRIRYAQQNGQTHLHVIVGKGNHSANHVQKIKPRVEQVCQELGLQYATEANAGRMYINLAGGPATMPPADGHQHGHQHGGYQGPPPGGYPGQQQHQQPGHHENNENDELEKLARKMVPRILKKLDGCCVVM
ncbi:smr domain-containing protein [Diplocarpon rosae]|nr:smr domain-containing protein [Diplocarpon rosae]